ncbi:P-loop NTPase fold protein [Stenotrophomonas sp.]|uniref:P-loop NTPase fold protein n=1 Tax=Stenotrophomonas sp. TaxID=69392 RepID=UPI00289E7902|nr:P-loop NTPase fold protein [Stenotrophomonas sp.]
MKDRIHSYLADYIEGDVDPGTAVLITGPWGCGKTRFIQDFFGITREARKASQKPADADTEPQKALIASFFGAQTQLDLVSQFAAQRHPLLKNKAMQAIGAVTKIGLRAVDGAFTGGQALSGEEGNGLMAWLGSPGDHVLVFDDLERSSMPLIERLATINRYVETMGLRVIVIANEKELLKDDDYLRWKEKVIGKTLRVDTAPDVVLKELAGQLKEVALKDCVQSNIEPLSDVLKQLDSINYRSVRSLIFDVQRLVKAAPKLATSEQAMLSILTFSLAVGSLVRGGLIKRNQVDLSEYVKKLNSDSPDAEKSAHLIEMHHRFRMVEALQPIVPPEQMGRLWCDGEIDEDQLKEITSTHHWIVGDDAQPAWLWLREPQALSVTRFNEQRKKLIRYIDGGAIVEGGVLLHIVDIHLELQSMRSYLFPEGTDVVAWVKNYLTKYDVRGNGDGHGGFSTLQHGGYRFRSSSSEFNDSAELIRSHLAEKEADSLRQKAINWIQDVARGNFGTLAFDVEELPGCKAWLHLVDASVFAQILLQDGEVKTRPLAALESRYARDNLGELEQEWPWLEQLREVLDAEVSDLPAPHQRIASDAFAKSFDYIDKQLEFGRDHLATLRSISAQLLAAPVRSSENSM